MQQNPSLEANSLLETQELPGNANVHHRGHKSPLLSPVPVKINPVHTLQSCSFTIRVSVVFPSAPLSSKLSLSFSFSTKTQYAFLFSPLHVTRPAHLILYSIPQIIFGDRCRSWTAHYATFCSHLFLPPHSQMYSSSSHLEVPQPVTWSTKWLAQYQSSVTSVLIKCDRTEHSDTLHKHNRGARDGGSETARFNHYVCRIAWGIAQLV